MRAATPGKEKSRSGLSPIESFCLYLVALAFAPLSTVANAQKTSTAYDQTINFSNYKTLTKVINILYRPQ